MEYTPDQTSENTSYRPPLVTKVEKKLWHKLHKEIKSFGNSGILYPIHNEKLSSTDHYTNLSDAPTRKVARPLYDRIQTLSDKTRRKLLPPIYYHLEIEPTTPSKSPSWLGDTITTRRKYDQWYWKTRITRHPFNQAVKIGTNPLMTKIQQRAHDYHIKAAIERNSHLEGPPKWLIISSIKW